MNLNRYHLREALAAPDSLRFWTVARHRMAILPGEGLGGRLSLMADFGDELLRVG
ncbi:MAG: hypothetical protein ABJB47_14245 [Actinomycetota bacterium]